MEFLKKYWYVTSFVVGLLSGCATFGAMLFEIERSPVLPGFVFGLIVLLYGFLFSKASISFFKSVLWIIFSGLSFITAFFSSKLLFFGNSSSVLLQEVEGTTLYFYFVSMGIIGAIVIMPAFIFFIEKLSIFEMVTLILSAGTTPLLTGLVGNFYFRDETFIFFSFLPWQAAVMVVFAHAINRSNQIDMPVPSQTV